ncbi:MAG TPA: c-type cytochrome [Methylotenera sp.]|nr:c-type cytochrome [Methylotenera sp.]HPV44715.1 c-type cytochrome [Methylotenera sp.]
MKYIILGISLLSLAGCTTQKSATDAAPKNTAASEKIQTCAACHGPDGKQGKEGVPPLGGRSYEELVKAMQNVREAYSPQPLLGHTLTDAEIHDIAIYYSSVK